MKKLLVLTLLSSLLIILFYEAVIIYNLLPKENQILKTEFFNLEEIEKVQNNLQVNQFSQNMRFNHNQITYAIDENCSIKKRENMIKAFNTLSKETIILNFIENLDTPDIQVLCSSIGIRNEENSLIAGEGGPIRYLNYTVYPLILKGQILLYENSNCKTLIVEMHELLHVLGFDHSEDKTDIMYPKTDCTQELKIKYIQAIQGLYQISPKSELYFQEIGNITKSGRYLNFELTIANKGIINADNLTLKVYSNEREINSFSLGNINFGESQKFTISNLKLPSQSLNSFTFQIDSNNQEYNYDNNILKASL